MPVQSRSCPVGWWLHTLGQAKNSSEPKVSAGTVPESFKRSAFVKNENADRKEWPQIPFSYRQRIPHNYKIGGVLVYDITKPPAWKGIDIT